MEQSRAATAKELRMALLVARMEQKESPQQRIGRHFGGARQLAPAICLGFGETEQLARSPRRIEPDPPMEWPQQYPHHFHEKIGNTGIAPIHGSVVGPGVTYCEYPESPEWFMTIARVIQLAVASPAPGDNEARDAHLPVLGVPYGTLGGLGVLRGQEKRGGYTPPHSDNRAQALKKNARCKPRPSR
jgi:hypothetical protein